MHLKKITLKNFRCFEELKIDLHPRLTVLVAENGGGKTAILDGIALGLSPILQRLSSANQRLSGPGFKDTDFRLREVPNSHRVSDYVQILVEAEVAHESLKWENWKPSQADAQRETKVRQKALTKYTSEILESLKSSTPKLLPLFVYYGAARGWIVVPKPLWESKLNYSHPTSALVGALASLTDFKEAFKWFELQEANELRANKGLSLDAYQPFPSLSLIRAAIRSLLGGDYQNPHFNHEHKFVVESPSTLKELQVQQLSQGYQSMLALGMDFAYRLAIANSHLNLIDTHDWSQASQYVKAVHPSGLPETPPLGPAWAPAIMLVDEIDLHLHPSWQQRVLPDLMRTFPCTQFIVTTHSPQVLSTVPSESIRIIQDGKVYSATPGTEGAEAQRILETVFQVSPRPNTPMSKMLDEYLRLVDSRQWDSERAIELRQKLDDWSQGYEPRLLEADLQIDNMKWEEGLL